jgi:inorganic pyrophosphatase
MNKDYATKFIGQTVTVEMDRPMGSKHPKWGFIYPINYGEIPETEAPDGAAVDAYVLGVFEPQDEFSGKCIAVIHRTDNDDDKLIVVPEDKVYSDEQILALTEFQERYFSPTVLR